MTCIIALARELESLNPQLEQINHEEKKEELMKDNYDKTKMEKEVKVRNRREVLFDDKEKEDPANEGHNIQKRSVGGEEEDKPIDDEIQIDVSSLTLCSFFDSYWAKGKLA